MGYGQVWVIGRMGKDGLRARIGYGQDGQRRLQAGWVRTSYEQGWEKDNDRRGLKELDANLFG